MPVPTSSETESRVLVCFVIKTCLLFEERSTSSQSHQHQPYDYEQMTRRALASLRKAELIWKVVIEH